MRSYRLFAVFAAVALMLSSSAPAAASSRQPRLGTEYWGKIDVDGQLWQRAPFLEYSGTSYVGVWYVQQLLGQHGIRADWDGKTLTLGWMPAVHQNAATMVDSTTVRGAHTITIQGTVYADTSLLTQRFGIAERYNTAQKTLIFRDSTHPARTMTSTHPARVRTANQNNRRVAVSSRWANIAGFASMSVLKASGTSFLGVWYVERLLEQNGIQVGWQKGTLRIDGLPQVVPSGNVEFGNNALPSALVTYRHHWYVPLTNLMGLLNISAAVDKSGDVHIHVLSPETSGSSSGQGNSGGTGTGGGSSGGGTSGADGFTVSGQIQGPTESGSKLAFITSGGDLQIVSDVPLTGAFQADLPGDHGTLIGVYTPALGWIGETASVDKTSDVLNVSLVQDYSTVSGTIVAGGPGENVAKQTVELRSELTHAHFSVMTNATGAFQAIVPVGMYEVWSTTVNHAPVFLGTRFFATPGNQTVPAIVLPKLPAAATYVSQDAIVVAGTADVPPLALVSVDNMFERIVKYDVAQTGISAQVPVTIQVFATTPEYTQHFRDEGYSATDAQNFGQNSQASAEGPDAIAVDLDGLGTEWGVNVIAHEFTHCLVAEVSQTIPDWANEGLAWREGIGAQADVSPSDLLMNGLNWEQWEDIVAHQQKGDLFSLGQANSLDPRYNVEAQDYFAVNMLINQFGMTKIMDYIRRIDALKDAPAFQQTFGEPETRFFDDVTKQLKLDAAGVNHGLSVQVRILPNGPSQVFVCNPVGKTYWYDGLQPGSYRFLLHADGTVTPPAGMSASSVVDSSGDGTWDVGSQRGGEQALFSISNSFGLSYLAQQIVFPAGSNDGISETATELPIGVQLTEIRPLP